MKHKFIRHCVEKGINKKAKAVILSGRHPRAINLYLRPLALSSLYETVIGLEVHVQLSTITKLFSSESTAFGDEPNSGVGPITLAHPGTLPMLNRKAVEYAMRLGLALESQITPFNYFSRKNYFYPDLPKGYQVTQHTTPVCMGGKLTVTVDGTGREIALHHIHLEEDAGKSIHDNEEVYSSIDLNRAGTPLLEIVTEPVIRNGEEAYQFLYEVRRLVRYLDICDGNMEQGNLRCDANVSVRKKEHSELGTRIEIKNLNSMRFVREAINYESERLVKILESGESIKQETRSFDDRTMTTRSSREKEEAHDYRYFPEPDLPPFVLSEEKVRLVREQMPVLPQQRKRRYMGELGQSEYDAAILTEDKDFSDYYEKLLVQNANPKSAANWMIGPVRSWLNANNRKIDQFPVTPVRISSLISMVEDGKISFSMASTRLLNEVILNPAADPMELAVAKNLLKQSDATALEAVVDEVLQNFAAKVNEYRKGKKGLLSMFVGEVMKRTGGQADPQVTNQLLQKKLNEK